MSAGQQVLQLAVAGLTTGAIYALMALGFVLLFTTTRIINVAIGEFATLAIFFILTFLHRGLTYAAAALAALFVVGVGAVVLYRLFFYPLLRREAGVVVLLIVSIALHLLLRGLALIGWGTRSYALPALWEGGPLHMGSIVFQRQYLFVLGAAAFFAVIFWLFFTRTLWGKALRASAVNPVGARLVGIPVLGMGGLAFTISALLAAMGGILAAPLTLATYDMGFMLGLKGFVGAIIGGGLVSLPGAVVGSLALGLLESLAAGLLPSGYRDAVAFSLLILVLIWRALPHIRRGVLLREEAASE